VSVIQKDVITIGDAMITFNSMSKRLLRYVHSYERKVGGAELNFSIGCSRLGIKTGFISRIGNDEFGRYALNFIRGEGIDTSDIKLIDDYPTSINFKEILEDGSGRTFYYHDRLPTEVLTDKNSKFKLATCAFVNFAVIENTFLYAVVSNFISLLNASLAVRYPNILRGRLFIHCWIFLIV